MKKFTILVFVLLIAFVIEGACFGTSAFAQSGTDYEINGSILYIIGPGSMPNYASGDETPWAEYRDDIERIVIDNTVDSVGDYAFAGFGNTVRVEFLQDSVPAISSSAFSGTTAVCRYYSAWSSVPADTETVKWINLPYFDAEQTDSHVLYYGEIEPDSPEWYINARDENNEYIQQVVSPVQALEYTYDARLIVLYKMPEENDPVIGAGYEKVTSLTFYPGTAGSMTIEIPQDSMLSLLDISSPGVAVTISDPRPEGLSNTLLFTKGMLEYNGNINTLQLTNSAGEDGSLEIHGTVQYLHFDSQTSNYPFMGSVHVDGEVLSGTIYGFREMMVKGIDAPIVFPGMPLQTISEIGFQDEPIIRNGELNLTGENAGRVADYDLTLDDFNKEYQFINDRIYFKLTPKEGGLNPTDIDNIFDYNPNFDPDSDIMYGEDTGIGIYGWDTPLEFNGEMAEGEKLGLGSIQMDDCDVTLNCPVGWFNVMNSYNSTRGVNLMINDRVDNSQITIYNKSRGNITVQTGENGEIIQGEWQRSIGAPRYFENVSASSDVFKDGQLCVMSHRANEQIQAILPSDAVVMEAAGVDATVELEQAAAENLTDAEQSALESYLAASTDGDEAAMYFDVSVTGYSVDDDGNITPGESITQLNSAIPLVVSNPLDAENEDDQAYVLRLHENDQGGIDADQLTEPTSAEQMEFGSDLFSSYVIVKVGTGKSDYPGVKEAAAGVWSGRTMSGVVLALPDLPSGASYGTDVTISSDTQGLLNGTPSVSGSLLTFSTNSKPQGTQAVVKVGVSGGTDYNDYDVTVTITASGAYPSGNATLTLPSDLTEIWDSAFEGSDSFDEVILNEGLKTIRSRAFADCEGLRLVHVPDSVEFIAGDAFQNTDNVIFCCKSEKSGASYAQAQHIPYLIVP